MYITHVPALVSSLPASIFHPLEDPSGCPLRAPGFPRGPIGGQTAKSLPRKARRCFLSIEERAAFGTLAADGRVAHAAVGSNRRWRHRVPRPGSNALRLVQEPHRTTVSPSGPGYRCTSHGCRCFSTTHLSERAPPSLKQRFSSQRASGGRSIPYSRCISPTLEACYFRRLHRDESSPLFIS